MNNRQINKRMYKSINLRIRILLTAVITFLLITGCTSSYHKGPDLSETYRIDVEQMLREEMKLWKDTPHHMGGTSSSGADCSGFVMIVYDKLFGIKLPRNTENQVTVGVFTDKNDLKPGDLVFFKPPRIKRHVGIYLSNGEFAHTSSLKGVTISRIDDPYWNKSYWTSRRILR
ncbi:MAG: C40 family peptidase [Proteobacteria bacterium]|nr:C40 family peptidase [Pseudomonadota bacterium]